MPVTLEIARLLAPLTVAYAGFQAIAAIFVQQWTEFRVQVLFREHVVVCGLGWTGLRFAITFHDQGMQVVAIEKSPSATAVEECRRRGIPMLAGDATDRLTLSKAGTARARYLVAACGDDGANGDVALLVQTEAAERTRPIDCFVHISDDRLCALLEEAALLGSTNELTHIEYFNVYRIGPRALLNAHGITDTSLGAPHFLVIGAGNFGLSLVVEAAIRRSGARVAPPAVRVYFTNSPVRRSRTPRKSPASPTGHVSGVGRSLICCSISSIRANGDRPGRSHLLITVITGMPRRAQTRKSLRVWGSSPFPASMSITAESTADSTR